MEPEGGKNNQGETVACNRKDLKIWPSLVRRCSVKAGYLRITRVMTGVLRDKGHHAGISGYLFWRRSSGWWLSGTGMKTGNSSEWSADRKEAGNPEGANRFRECELACKGTFQPKRREVRWCGWRLRSETASQVDIGGGETESVNGRMKMGSGGWTRWSGLEVSHEPESGLRGAPEGTGPDKGTQGRGQGRRNAGLEDLRPTAGIK